MVLSDQRGWPVVIRNAPVLDDGEPMPTMFWLVGKKQRLAVDRLEAAGGVAAAEAAVDPDELEAAHRRYAKERDDQLPSGWSGPRPCGGVGGTRRGVKCLHAHYAWWLVGGDDPVGRWVAGQLVPAHGDRNVAAVDCGSLSTRLLVAGPDGQPLVRLTRVTALAEGVDRSHSLSRAAMERALSVLREYRRSLDDHGVQRVSMVGTSALRDARNRASFCRAAEAAVGAPLWLLSGPEEAQLSFAGATAQLPLGTAPWLVVDIGGGSTELARGPAPLEAISLDFGAVRVTERFLHTDPPAPAELALATAWLEQELKPAAVSLLPGTPVRTLIGLAGTVSALARYDQRLVTNSKTAVHHYVLSQGAVERALENLARLPEEKRRGQPGVEEGRARYIVGGALVLATVMREFGCRQCLVSEADLLDGLVGRLLAV